MNPAALYERVARRAAERPGHPAVIHEGGTLTYSGLHALLDRAERHFTAHDCGAGQRVGLLVRNDPRSIVSMLALAATGAEAVYLDARGTGHERAQAGRLAGVASWHAPWPWQEAQPRRKASAAAREEPARQRAHAPCFGLVTSGTGGLPKVVRKDWKATLANSAAFARTAGYTTDDRILCTTPLHHAFAFGVALLPALHTGATLVLAPHPPVPSGLAAALTETGATVVQSVPFLYRSLLAHGPPAVGRGPHLYVCAGEPLDRETAQGWRAATGRGLRDQYGATELGQIAFADGRTGLLRLVPGMRARLRGENGQWVHRPGAEGELCFRQPGPPVTYWGLPELTARATAQGWFGTGDIGCLPAADTVVVLGRAGRRITVAGRKVDPAEVELAVNSVTGVHECMVSAPPEGMTGAGDRFVAFVAARPEVTEIAVRRHLAGLLSPYKIPSRFHLTDRLPRTGSGKVHAARLWQEVGRL